MCFKYKISLAEEPLISCNDQRFLSEFSEFFVGYCGGGLEEVFTSIM